MLKKFFAILLVSAAFGCADKPAQLPSADIANRNAMMLGRVDIIVSDRDRAEATKKTLGEIAALGQAYRDAQLKRREALAKMDVPRDQFEAAAREVFAEEHKMRREYFVKYVDLQMKFRESVTLEEFTKLQEVN